MKIGIIGYGFVGGATARLLEKHHNIVIYDKYKAPYTNPRILLGCSAVFVCVPTPMKQSGEIDYRPIRDSLDTLNNIYPPHLPKPIVIIRSTAVSGTIRGLEKTYPYDFVFNPEFLREKHADEDMKNSNRVVIGHRTPEAYEVCRDIYKPALPNAEYIPCSVETAEMIKYAANVFLASQIAIANEIYNICNAVGVNYDDVKKVILKDDRISRNIDVPGPDGEVGFGGKCFPKDLNAMIYLSREYMYRPYLLEEVWRLNEHVRSHKDWLSIEGATSFNKK